MKRWMILTAAAAAVAASWLIADEDEARECCRDRDALPAVWVYKDKARETSGAQKLYREECGACHMAYQPELLPARSWEKMMATLESHFDSDASLDANDTARILAYLKANAADAKPRRGELAELLRGVRADDVPLRISELPYFKKEHRKIPKRLVTQKKVRSFANCNACHTRAEAGSYDEDDIVIPGYGRWED